jgi:hypothetical protein
MSFRGWLMFAFDTAVYDFCWSTTVTSGFVVPGSGSPVVHSHEVGILNEIDDEFSYAVSLS